MRAIRQNFHTDIYLTEEEFSEVCKPSARDDACSWLVLGPKGWQCLYFNRLESLDRRKMARFLPSVGDGCKKIIEFNPLLHPINVAIEF